MYDDVMIMIMSGGSGGISTGYVEPPETTDYALIDGEVIQIGGEGITIQGAE